MAENYGFNIDLGLNTSELRKGLKDVNRELSAEKSDMQAINAQLKYNANNVELWRKKQQKLTSTIEATKKKLQILQNQLKQAMAADDGSAEARKEIERLEKQIQKTTNEITKMTAELQGVGTKINQIGASKGQAIQKVGQSLTNHITKPALAAAAAVTTLTFKMSQSINELGDTAQQVGANAQAYQELIYASKILGADSDSLYRAFMKINDMMGDIATGDSLEAAQNLYRIGLSIDDIKGLDSTSAFLKIREALAGIEDQSLRVAMANEIFGDKIGARLLPLLNAEEEQITSLRNEAIEYGIATDDDITAADNFQDGMTRLKQSLYGVALSLMDVVLPAMESIVKNIREHVVPVLQGLIEKWNGLDEGPKTAIASIAAVAVAIGPVISILGTAIEAVSTLEAGFSAASGAMSALGAAGGPVVAAIVAVIAILIYAWNTSDEFQESIKGLMAKLGELIGPVMELVNVLMESLKPILDACVDIINALFKALGPIIDIMIENVIDNLKYAAEMISKVMEFLKPLITFISTTVVKVIEMVSKVLEPIIKALDKIWDFVKNIIDKVASFLGSTIGKAFSWIGEKLGGLFSNIIDNVAGAFLGGTTSYNNTTSNNVNVYTSASTFDVNSINDALGGSYL